MVFVKLPLGVENWSVPVIALPAVGDVAVKVILPEIIVPLPLAWPPMELMIVSELPVNTVGNVMVVPEIVGLRNAP